MANERPRRKRNDDRAIGSKLQLSRMCPDRLQFFGRYPQDCPALSDLCSAGDPESDLEDIGLRQAPAGLVVGDFPTDSESLLS